ncbi:hypothetical protein BTW15_13755 [Pseudomonas syringae pv. tomato]|uniref:Uncharacterized protein n=1 Tax=Pseudomonas syringae pv. tomato TaxID=323 RepID=A0AB36KVI9_PSEUB|nr:hypothetical protein BTW15_13755 [Pseudomonas syringae pv. tomato]POQ09331.1 hypothetical protein CXB40_05185 [Pseudomonas syringae pv. avii]TES55804.1 hypothetical protein E2N91_20310 [Pseudomonas syringae pv. tomato]TES76611.1 hypothetical protein E2N89_17635 [Pseudomonas syringae pv. tomato]
MDFERVPSFRHVLRYCTAIASADADVIFSLIVSRVRQFYAHAAPFDARNIRDCAELSGCGFLYHGIGRPVAGHCKVAAA